MKKKSLLWVSAVAVSLGSFLASCSDDESGVDGITTVNGYVLSITALDDNGTPGATYLLGAESLDEGNITSVKAGVETVAATAWVYFKDKYLYNLQYNQGSAGESESYKLNANGEIITRSGLYSITRFVTYGVCGENVITVSAVDTDESDKDGNKKKGLGFNFMHAADEKLSTKVINAENYLANGEFVTFAGFVEANGKVYTSVVPMGMSKWGVNNYDGPIDQSKVSQEAGGSSSSAYEAGVIPVTQYPDKAFIAIYNDGTFSGTPTIVETDQMGFTSGRMRSQYYQTIWADDAGNIYAFSPGYGRTHTAKYYTTGSKKASVMRIKKGATAFDADYGVVDIEGLAGGKSFLRCWHITGDYFLLQMFTGNDANPGGLESKGLGATRLAIYKGSSKSLNYVTGLPATDKITSFGSTPYSEKGVVYIPVTTSDGGSTQALYKIDPTTNTATKGLTVSAASISSVGKLTPQ